MALQRSPVLSGGMSNTILYIPVYHYDGHLEFPSGCTAERGGGDGGGGGGGGLGVGVGSW